MAALSAHVDESLLPAADHQGFSGLPVAAEEHHDPYRTVEELLTWIGEAPPVTSLPTRERLVKALLQLQHAVHLSDDALAPVLTPLLEGFLDEAFVGRPVTTVARIRPEARVDRRTMWPLTTGSKVLHPLGVTLFGSDGSVLSKAKVLCH